MCCWISDMAPLNVTSASSCGPALVISLKRTKKLLCEFDLKSIFSYQNAPIIYDQMVSMWIHQREGLSWSCWSLVKHHHLWFCDKLSQVMLCLLGRFKYYIPHSLFFASGSQCFRVGIMPTLHLCVGTKCRWSTVSKMVLVDALSCVKAQSLKLISTGVKIYLLLWYRMKDLCSTFEWSVTALCFFFGKNSIWQYTWWLMAHRSTNWSAHALQSSLNLICQLLCKDTQWHPELVWTLLWLLLWQCVFLVPKMWLWWAR